MAILRGFPPSNPISPTIRITECDLSQIAEESRSAGRYKEYETKFKAAPSKPLTKQEQKNYAHKHHARNVWLERKEFGKAYQFDIEGMLARLMSHGISVGVGEKLMKELIQLALDASEVFVGDKMASSDVSWFMWLEYHLIHALSLQLSTDLRPVWLKTWEGSDKPWMRQRMREQLIEPTPLARRLNKIRPEKTIKRNVVARRKLEQPYWL